MNRQRATRAKRLAEHLYGDRIDRLTRAVHGYEAIGTSRERMAQHLHVPVSVLDQVVPRPIRGSLTPRLVRK